MTHFIQAIQGTQMNVPVSILQTILNLAEFLEREEELKLFTASTLGELAQQCNAGAKALYYQERDPNKNIELLIQTNLELQQPEAALGILVFAKKAKLLLNENIIAENPQSL